MCIRDSNPDAILDPIITDLSTYYQIPIIIPPLDPDPDLNGKPSDHNGVLMPPINDINLFPARESKKVTYRPLPKSGINKFGKWIQEQSWEEIYDQQTPSQKAETFQKLLMNMLDEVLPEKQITLTSDDQPWITAEIKCLGRKKKREFWKHRKSTKFQKLKKLVNKKTLGAKKLFYSKYVQNLKQAKPGQWYGKLKG